MKRALKAVILLFIAIAALSAPADAHVYVAGSDVAQWFPKAALKAYESSADVTINKSKYNKNTAIIALAQNDSCDIALSTWQLSELDNEEVLRALSDAEAAGVLFSQTPFVIDAIPPIVHRDNPVKKMTLDQLHGIYTGKITNWHELDESISPDIPIDVYSTSESDGKYIIWKDLVTKGNASDDVGYGRAPKDMSALIARDENKWAIGFDSMYYIMESEAYRAGSVDIVALTNYERLKEGPSREYPVSRYLYAITRNDVSAEAQKFLDYLLDSQTQKYAEAVHQIPLTGTAHDGGGSGCIAAPCGAALAAVIPLIILRRKKK